MSGINVVRLWVFYGLYGKYQGLVLAWVHKLSMVKLAHEVAGCPGGCVCGGIVGRVELG